MVKFYKKVISIIFLLILAIPANKAVASNQSVARKWNEALIFSIRRDFARPTIHARNIFHISIAMYDAWAAFDSTAATFFLGRTNGSFTCPYNGILQPTNVQEAQEEAISYASYRLLKQRFQFSPNATQSLLYYDSLMNNLGYPTDFYSQDYSGGNPAALGNYIAAKIIEFGYADGSNQQNNYANQYYQSANPQIIVNNPGNPTLIDPNRWQAIFLDEFIDQNGNVISISPPFLSPEWGDVVPFALNESHKTTYQRDGHDFQVYMDPSAPPYIDTTQLSDFESPYKWGFTMVSVWQSHLDPSDDVMWDISPASIGNNPQLPENPDDYPSFYNFIEGGDQSQGWDLNPKTGLPYTPQMVKRGDYARVLAEFWADGPDSETPPGHWFTILNYVGDHPEFEKRWNGEGPIIADLDWDVKSYLTLAGGMHDAAICAWSAKGWYDYPRPVSMIRWMAEKGQSTDPDLPRFNNAGIPLIPGHVELVMPGDPLAGDNDENLYKIKLYTWKGHAYIADPETDIAGVDWILADDWWTYQRPTFVTPPFSGYISGHSTFSRTAAEIMTQITGDSYFPGGMGEFHAGQNSFLHFEEGPSQDIVLQWATYQDASDQCSLSRIWGGIHPPQDDIPGRKIGIELGPMACEYAETFINAGKAYVTDVQMNNSNITDNSIAQGLDVTVSYNEAMNTTVMPLIDFTNLNANTTFQFENATWQSATTCMLHYSIQDLDEDMNAIGLRISSAIDTSNTEQKFYLIANALTIATKNPSITTSTANTLEINQVIGASQALTVDVTFDEIMDINQSLLVNVNASPLQSGLTLNESLSGWVNASTYHFEWELLLAIEECPEVHIEFSNALDLDGNTLIPESLNQTITIDTKVPEIDLVTANTYEVTPLNANNELQVLAVFVEPMDNTVAPSLDFIDNSNASTILSLNNQTSAWLSEYTYRFKYSVFPTVENIEDIGIKISNARDVIGNEMIPDTIENFMDIHLNPVSIASLSAANNSMLLPNPVKVGSNVSIKLPDYKSVQKIQLINTIGSTVTSIDAINSESQSLNTYALAPGVYYIKIIRNLRTEMLQLVVVQ